MPADGTSPASVSADRLPPVANLYGRPLVSISAPFMKKQYKHAILTAQMKLHNATKEEVVI